jgi:hypothetical protein
VLAVLSLYGSVKVIVALLNVIMGTVIIHFN